MSDNPLEYSPQRDARIRERAYHLWEADGRPHGQDLEYWLRASELVGMEESPGAGLEQPSGHDSVMRDDVIDEAELQENLGEFPDRFTDQGDRPQTPTRKARQRRAAA